MFDKAGSGNTGKSLLFSSRDIVGPSRTVMTDDLNSSETVRDPVCGMTVDPATTKHHADHAGATYHFCSAACRAKFLGEPGKYLPQAGTAHHHLHHDASPEKLEAIYTCPMHPQIRQKGPGHCPICGMALEPEMVSAEIRPNPEFRDMSRRFWVGLALAMPVVALEMGGHLVHLPLGQGLSNWIQLALATPVVLWAGWPFFVRGWQS
ncbi:MAG TPA: heavy metal-binding domain-containing protein, partial [Rhizomicrobium sp.]|nr:heavy metal-binding domain-containing protein [Rhizomicrobium sp.]